MTLPEEKKETPKQKNIFSGNNNKSDFSFADPDKDDADDLTAKVEEPKVEAKEEEAKVEEVKAEETNKEEAADILDTLDNETEEDVVKAKKGRKPINGISDVFSKLIKDDKIVPFDDDKELE